MEPEKIMLGGVELQVGDKIPFSLTTAMWQDRGYGDVPNVRNGNAIMHLQSLEGDAHRDAHVQFICAEEGYVTVVAGFDPKTGGGTTGLAANLNVDKANELLAVEMSSVEEAEQVKRVPAEIAQSSEADEFDRTEQDLADTEPASDGNGTSALDEAVNG